MVIKAWAKLAAALVYSSALTLLGQTASAQSTKVAEIGDYYVGVGAGASIPVSLHASVSPTSIFGLSGSGRLTMSTTGQFSFLLGYYLTDWFVLEVDGSRVSYSLGDFSSTLFSPVIPANLGQIAFNGTSEVWMGQVSALVRPFGRPPRSTLSPYVGIGAGMAVTDLHLDSISTGQFALAGAPTNFSTTSPAAQVLIGLDYVPNARLSIGLRYSFVWVDSNDSRFVRSSSNLVSFGDMMSHNITLTAAVHF